MFQKTILSYFKSNKRNFAWRDTENPYRILVSEIMLQQTQTNRIVEKYDSFLKSFPTIKKLSNASLSDVLKVWQGMGYNRRALYLKKISEQVVKKYHGKIPTDVFLLSQLPGIGPATAGAICAFAYNQPVFFIETNIRSVFIHFFFKKKKNVKDSEIMPLIETTLYKKNPREWYWALMDYGAMLKKTKNPSKKSAHFIRQSTFKGSNRQLRGEIIRRLSQKSPLTKNSLFLIEKFEKSQIEKAFLDLEKEGFVKIAQEKVSLI